MAEPLPLAEIEARLMLLPPISRGEHLAGPRLHSERLVEIWRADGEVPLSQAFRLLDVEAVTGVVLRATVDWDVQGDPRYWQFPSLADLLRPLREAVWLEVLAGTFVLEAIKGITGRHRPLMPALLPRLTPDWELSRLTRDGADEYIDVRVRPMPAAAIPRQGKPSRDEFKAAVEDAAEAYSSEAPPPFDEFWTALKIRAPGVTQRQVRAALKNQVPHLRRRRGQHEKIKSSG